MTENRKRRTIGEQARWHAGQRHARLREQLDGLVERHLEHQATLATAHAVHFAALVHFYETDHEGEER